MVAWEAVPGQTATSSSGRRAACPGGPHDLDPPVRSLLRGRRPTALPPADRGTGLRHDDEMIKKLARVAAAPPGKPVRERAGEAQERSRRLALRADTWDRREAAAMMAGFDAAAITWEAGRGGYRRPVLADALAGGGPFGPGLAVEIASGIGLLTPLIQDVWPAVVAVDLSHGMLACSAARHRVQADAARLPLADDSADAVVVGDGPLFAAEAARIMSEGHVLVWANRSGVAPRPSSLPRSLSRQ